MSTRHINSETKSPSAFDRFEQYSRMLNSLVGRIAFVIARVLFNIIAIPVAIVSYLAQKVVTIWNESKRSDVRKAARVFLSQKRPNAEYSHPMEQIIRERNEQRTASASIVKEGSIADKTELTKKQKAIKKSVNEQIEAKSAPYKRFNEILKDWEQEVHKDENRKEAVKRIKEFALLNKSDKKHRSCLDLSGLHLSSLPDVFLPELSGAYRFLRIQVLNLKGNQLTALPKSIENLKFLEELNLKGNQIAVLPEKIFDNLKSLQDLDLGNNQLTTLPEKIFSNLKVLQGLDLGNNQITALPEKIFDGLQLKGLFLKKNKLESLPESFKQVLPHLRMLDLKGNQISKDDLKMIRKQKSIKFFYESPMSLKFKKKKNALLGQTSEVFKTFGKKVSG